MARGKLRQPTEKDVSNPKTLTRMLGEIISMLNSLEGTYAEVKEEVKRPAEPDYKKISRELSANGTAPLVVEGLIGQLQQPQRPEIPRVKTLPDPRFSPYHMVLLTGTPDRVYRLKTTANPPIWEVFQL